jgi:hypothetical protein
MNELIYALMQTGMTYRQAEEEVFRMLKRKRFPKENEDVERCQFSFSYQQSFWYFWLLG